MKVCFLGATLPNGNYGVQALAASLVTLFLRLHPNASIGFVCGGSGGTYEFPCFVDGRWVVIPVLNYRMSPRARWREHLLTVLLAAVFCRLLPFGVIRRRFAAAMPIFRALSESDFIGDIRGGDGFSDIYGFWGLVEGSLPALIALVLGRKLVLLPQTYGPYQRGASRWLASWLIRRSAIILARDQESLNIARELSGKGRTHTILKLCPDVAFLLCPKKPANARFEPPLPEDPRAPLIGFNVSGLLYHGGFNQRNMFGLRDDYPRVAKAVLEYLLTLPGVHVLLISHMYPFQQWNLESDTHASAALVKDLAGDQRHRVHLLSGECDQHELKGVIGRCSFFIGSRMHACIAALSQGVPAVGIAYSRKFRGVFETVGLQDYALDACRLSVAQIVEEVSRGYQQAETIRPPLCDRVRRVQEEILQGIAAATGAVETTSNS
jgi:colanic acid/amylovoran biosynthesis protein